MEVKRASFEDIWNNNLAYEANLPFFQKIAHCLAFIFARCEPLVYRLEKNDPLRGPALRFCIKEFILACVDNYGIFYTFYSFFKEHPTTESLREDRFRFALLMLSAGNLLVRILFTFYHISKFPITFMMFHNLPVINLFTSIKATSMYTDLNSSFTKEYDGFRFNLCNAKHKLANVPFIIVEIILIYRFVPGRVLFSKISSVISLALAIIFSASKFLTSMQYRMAGCDYYEDFMQFTETH